MWLCGLAWVVAVWWGSPLVVAEATFTERAMKQNALNLPSNRNGLLKTQIRCIFHRILGCNRTIWLLLTGEMRACVHQSVQIRLWLNAP